MLSLRAPRSKSSMPSSLIPVPASSTRTVPSLSETSTHDVFPPNSTVSGPGVATEPRQPQIVTRTVSSRLAPEDGDDADELVCMGEQRESGHRDFALGPVSARDPNLLVCRAPLFEGDSRGQL